MISAEARCVVRLGPTVSFSDNQSVSPAYLLYLILVRTIVSWSMIGLFSCVVINLNEKKRRLLVSHKVKVKNAATSLLR